MNLALLKLQRSRKHLRDLKCFLLEYRQSNPNILTQFIDPVSGESSWRISISDNILEQVSLYMGDIVHNARSSLDLLANYLVRDAGFTPNRRTYFPFVRQVSDLQSKLSETMLDLIDPQKLHCITSNPPSKDENPLLYSVHELDIVDKHRSIFPSTSFLHIERFHIPPPVGFTLQSIRMPLQDGRGFIGGVPDGVDSATIECISYPVFTISDDDLGFSWSTQFPDKQDDIVEQAEIIIESVDVVVNLLVDA